MVTERVKLLRKQFKMLAYKKKWGACRGGVGAGKTVGWCYWMIDRMERYPKASHFVIGADYEQLRRGFLETFRGILEKHGFEEGKHFTYRAMPSPMLTFKHNGARLRCLSAELAQRIRSVEFQSVVLEEPQTWFNGSAKGKDVYEVIIGRLRHTERSSTLYGDELQPQGRMSFNPPSVAHWLYDLIERKWPVEGYTCWQMSIRENVLLRGREELIRDIESTMSPERVLVEVDGNWATVGGNVYLNFNRAEMSRDVPGLPPLALDPSKPILWSFDFNVHKMCSVVAQVHTQKIVSLGFDHNDLSRWPKEIKKPALDGWQRRVLSVVDEFVLRNVGTPSVAQAFIEKYGDIARQSIVYLYGDPSGDNRSQNMDAASSVWSAWDAILQALDLAGIKWENRVPKNHPSLGNRIYAVNGWFKSADGRCGFRIDPVACPEVCNDLEMVMYKEGSNDLDKTDLERTHMSDALGYMLWVERELEKNQHLEFKQFHYMER